MRILASDFRKGFAKVRIDNLDDLWYLSNIIEEGDFVKGQTIRKIKIGEDSSRIAKKVVFLKIKVEKVELADSVLRVLGIITEGPEDVPIGSHHSFALEEGSIISIEKNWLGYQIEKLKEAAREKISKILLVVFDREEVYFAKMKKEGYELMASLKGDVAKKIDEKSEGKNFYIEIINAIEGYDKKLSLDHIILASPSFWKEELLKNLKNDDLRKKLVLATCSSCDEKAFNEVIKRKEVETVLKEDRSVKEIKLVEELLAEISKQGLFAYGIKDVEEKASFGAAKTLLVCESYIKKARDIGKFGEIDKIMKMVEGSKGEVVIISSKHDAGKKLEGIGGIGAILRYKI